MNFSEFNESLQNPLFEKKGEAPKCPEGYKWNSKLGKCEPKVKQKAQENPGDKHRTLIGNFNVYGATGINGDGYALEDGGEASADAAAGAGSSMSEEVVTEMSNDWLDDHKYQKRLADEDQRNKAQDFLWLGRAPELYSIMVKNTVFLRLVEKNGFPEWDRS
mgnify:CR=1 FL=1